MNPKKPDHFSEKAKTWDKGEMRVANANRISRKILDLNQLTGEEHIMDFGAGTGLLSEGLAPFVSKITAVDYSSAMLEKFSAKKWPCTTEVLNIDLNHASIDYEFDGIISSMTIHHIEDIEQLFEKFYGLLKPGGFIALADLEEEDGSFHNNNTGVEHFGFDPKYFQSKLQKAGFISIKSERVNEIQKELDGNIKSFPVFLAVARK